MNKMHHKKRKLEPRERTIRPGVLLGALRDEYGDFFGGFVGLPFSLLFTEDQNAQSSDLQRALWVCVLHKGVFWNKNASRGLAVHDFSCETNELWK